MEKDISVAEAVGVAHAVEQYHRLSDELMTGNPEPQKRLFSHRDDVSLLNPIVPRAHGWQQVARTLEEAAALIKDGETISFENIAARVHRGF